MKLSHQWQKVTYQNQNGINLVGLLYSEPAAAGTVVVVCHGFVGTKEGGGRAITMAEELGLIGYSTLLFDFTGSGESEGDFAGISLTRHIGDVRSSVDFCLGLGFNRVVTVGRSFGGTAAICLGRYEGRVAGVCTWAAPGNLQEVFSRYRELAKKTEGDLFSIAEEQDAPKISKGFFTDLDRYDVCSQAALITPASLLIIHGEQDQTVPVSNAQAIFNAAEQPKIIKIIPGADHQFTERYQLVWETFFGWMRENFPVNYK